MSNTNAAVVYTDGSCHTQQCIGAWVALIFIGTQKLILQDTATGTTHHRMELTAVINAVDHIRAHHPGIDTISIYSDSQYVIGLRARAARLTARDFITKKGHELHNADLVRIFLEQLSTCNIELVKVKAHQPAGNSINYNAEADVLSRQLVRDRVV